METKVTWKELFDIAAECVNQRTNYDTGMTYTEFDANEFVRLLQERAINEAKGKK